METLGEIGRRFGCERELEIWLKEHILNNSVSKTNDPSFFHEELREEVKQFTERELKRELLRTLPFKIRWKNDTCTISLSVLAQYEKSN